MHRIIVISLLLLIACGDSPRTDGAVDVPDTETEVAPEVLLEPVDQALIARSQLRGRFSGPAVQMNNDPA